jgi:hypothetical protein
MSSGHWGVRRRNSKALIKQPFVPCLFPAAGERPRLVASPVAGEHAEVVLDSINIEGLESTIGWYDN